MQLINKYSEPSGGATNYLLIPDGTFTNGGAWSAIYLKNATPCPTNLQELFWILYHKTVNGVNSTWAKCWFVFFGNGWSDQTDFKSLSKSIESEIDTLNDNSVNGRFIWYNSSINFSRGATTALFQLPFNEVTDQDGSQGAVLNNPGAQPFFPAFNSGGAKGQPFFDHTNNAVWFDTLYPNWNLIHFDGSNGNGTGPYLKVILNGHVGQSINLLSIPDSWNNANVLGFCQLFFQGDNAGRIIVTGTGGGVFESLIPEFVYSIDQGSSSGLESSCLKYPIIESDDWKNWVGAGNVQCSFSPARPEDSSVSYISIPVNDVPVKSNFRTVLGSPVNLKSKSGNVKLAFNNGIDSQLHLTLDGEFVISVDGEDSPQLLCGLSGTESIAFQSGDTMVFYSGQPAGIEATFNSDVQSPQSVVFSLSEEIDYRTAYAMIIPQSGQPGCSYYTEPDGSSFFKNDPTLKDTKELSYFAKSLIQLSVDVGTSPTINMFPIVPYYGVAPTGDNSGFGNDPGYLEALEFQVLNPNRQKAIKAMNNPIQSNRSDTLYALTPQGYQSAFMSAHWQSIEIANVQIDSTANDQTVEVSNVQIAFSNRTALADPIQTAFLANQQFLVMTANVSGNLDDLKAQAMMSDWSFDLNMPSTTSPGNYSNVFIFKSGSMTISQMAQHPQLWTQYAAFNDTASDPEGIFLSNWMVSYLEDAKTLYDDGNGVSTLANFCELIDDPNWNGFLALKVPVGDMSTLPTDLQAIVADIDGTLYAHHLGNEINHISAPAASASGMPNPYVIKSPFFGLIHYINPNFAGQNQNPPSFINNSTDYNFDVLTLEVVFEKALETHFGCKCLLTMNTFFGDKVLPYGPDGELSANTAVIVGTYHDVDNVSSYSFSTVKGSVTDFYLSSNAFNCNRITDISMNVIKDPASTVTDDIYHAGFFIRGNFEFLNNPQFDLLSYDTLSYDGLELDVRIERVTGNGSPQVTKTYAMDTSKIKLINNRTVTLPATQKSGTNYVRSGSLVSQFPMKLKGFIQSAGGSTPSDMGYRLLQTATPSGVSFSNLAEGAPWCGLAFDMILGGKGALASSPISASMILAWSPGGSGVANASPQFKLSGPGGVSLSFSFEEVLKFGAKDILFNRYIDADDATKNYFYMIFQSIGLSMLGISFPPGGTTNLVLMGDTAIVSGETIQPTLSWFGGYAEKETTKEGEN